MEQKNFEYKGEYEGSVCIFKDKMCNAKCVAYNKNPKYPSKCTLLNQIGLLAINTAKQSGRKKKEE